VQGALGFTFVTGGFHAHADYVFHPWILEEREAFTLPAYIGPGVRLLQHRAGRGADDDFRVGARAVAGLLFDFKEIPLDVFVEVAGIARVPLRLRRRGRERRRPRAQRRPGCALLLLSRGSRPPAPPTA
jgi:hypothetical protein